MENWKDVVGFEGKYMVSDYGRIKSLDRIIIDRNGKSLFRRGKTLSIIKGNHGYICVALGRGNKRLVSRLVAEAFIKREVGKTQVNHINGIKTDNHIDNLEWVSPSENITHSYRLLDRLNGKRIVQLTRDGMIVDFHNSASSAARKIKGNRSHIAECCAGKRKTSDNYKWQFI